MSSGTCTRCGMKSEMEYGADGLPYCSSCIFYGLNRQCWRCRMYLPASELQQYKGQWACPYCIQDMRDADRKAEEHIVEKPKLEVLSYPETCERCGRDLKGRVYIWNDKRLCRNCVGDEQEKWGLVGGGPMGAPYKVSLEPENRRKRRGFIETAIGEFLVLLGLKKRKKLEVVVVGGKMPISRAKPMAEAPMYPARPKEERKPQSEGIMRIGKAPPIELEKDERTLQARPARAAGPRRGAPGDLGHQPHGSQPPAAGTQAPASGRLPPERETRNPKPQKKRKPRRKKADDAAAPAKKE
ncbi:MAG: hypothetical protein AB1529_06235 [Candidatus Micrarchaeota archaeon]